MHIIIVCVGKMKEGYWKDAQLEYEKRLSSAIKMEIVEVSAERLGGSVADKEAMRREGERLMTRITDDAVLIALDKSGVQFDSENFSHKLDEISGDGTTIVFAIGGAAGLDPGILNAARMKLSLSKMTLSHEMARVFLLEQVYRATQILKGGKYHR